MKFCCQAFFDNWSSTINFVGILNCWLTLHPAGKILYSVKQNLFVDLVRVISRELILRDWSHTTCWYIELSTLTPHLAEKILYSVKFVAGFFFKELAMANAPTHAFLIITCFYQVCTDYQAEFFKKNAVFHLSTVCIVQFCLSNFAHCNCNTPQYTIRRWRMHSKISWPTIVCSINLHWMQVVWYYRHIVQASIQLCL